MGGVRGSLAGSSRSESGSNENQNRRANWRYRCYIPGSWGEGAKSGRDRAEISLGSGERNGGETKQA